MKLTLVKSDKYSPAVSLFYCKTYARGVIRTQSIIYNKAFLWYLKRICSIDVRLGSKYATAYIYIQVSPIEIICILNIFAVKYTFSDKRRMKFPKPLFNISLFVFPLHHSFPVTPQRSNLTQNIWHTSFLLRQQVFNRNKKAITSLLGR